MNGTRRLGLLLALSTACISGVAVYLNSFGVKAFGNASLYTTAKNIVAAVVLLAVVGIGHRAGATVTRPSGAKQWLGLAAIAIIGGSVPFILFFEGLARATAAHTAVQASFLQKTLVIWVAVLAILILRERLTWAHYLAIALLIAGQVGLAGGVQVIMNSGAGMVLAATLLWSVEVILAKRLLGSLSSWTVGLARMVAGSVVLIAWAMIQGHAGVLLHMTGTQWGWVLLTGVILAGYVATWFAALARAQAVDVTAVLVIGALITAVISAAVDGKALAPQLGWWALLVAGTVLVSWRMVRASSRVLAAGAAG